MTIEEDIKALIPSMTAQIAEQIRARTLANIEHSTAQAVADEVKKYIAETIMPAVRDDLAKQEAEIKGAVLAAVKGVAEALASTLVSKMTAKLASYEGDRMLKEVFGPIFRGY